MTPEQRRAHLVLHGQTLLDEWTEASKIKDEASKLWTESYNLWAKGSKFWGGWSELYAEGNKLYAEGSKFWYDAVVNEFGEACTITWENRGCILGCGERYTWIG